MEQTKPAHKFFIHPSIDVLSANIKKLDSMSNAPRDSVETLRETCLKKLKSYRLEDYLKRYTSEVDKTQARARWEAVTEFTYRRRS